MPRLIVPFVAGGMVASVLFAANFAAAAPTARQPAAGAQPAGPPALPPGGTWDGKRFAGGPAVTGFPSALNGLTVIAPPRGNGAKPAPEWSFRTNLPATVYLGVMDRAGYAPPADWQPTEMEIRSGNLIDRVYRRKVPAGTVTLPGHTGMAGPFFGVPHLVIVAADDGRQADLRLDEIAIPEAPPLPDPGPKEIDFRSAIFPSHDLLRFYLPKPPEGVSRWTVALRREGDPQPLAERSGTFPMAAAGENLETPELAAALYFVECTLEGDGAPVRLTRWFYRQTFPWEQEKLGLDDVVIPPFDPLSVDGSTARVSCVLRTHEHGPAGLWKQVTSQGRELLAGPVRLEATAGGKTVAATGGPPTITERKPTRVAGTAAWKAGGLEGNTAFAYDYDGYTEFTLTLAPTGAEMDRVQLVIPLKASEAWLLHPVTTLLRHHYAGRVPAGTGKVWDSANLPGGKMLGTFVPYVFVGGPERGICFAADNDRDWVPDPAVAACEIDREGETVNLRLNLVARPCRLSRPRTIRFALQATPAKPMPTEPVSWRRWWFTNPKHGQRHDVVGTMLGVNIGWGAAQLVTDSFPANEDVSFWEAMAANRDNGTMNWDYLERWKARYPALKDSFATYKWGLETVSGAPLNVAGSTPAKYIFPYLNPRGGSSLDPAFATTYLDEWSSVDVAAPGWKPGPDRTLREKLVPVWYGCEPVASNVDRQVWWLRKMVETFADGPYWDNFFTKPSWVPAEAGGPAYVDDEGRLKPGVNLSGFRSLVRRTAVMMHTLGKRPLSWIHMTNANVVPVLSFGAVNLDWEWRDIGGQAGVDIQDRLGIDRDPALVLVQSTGLQAGNVSVAIDRFHAKGKEAIAWQMRTGLAVCLPHEIRQKDGGPDAAFAQATLDEFGYGLPDCKVFRYWEEVHPLEATGARIRGLLLAREGKALLAIGNYGQEPPAGGQPAAAAKPAAETPASVEDYDAGVAKRGSVAIKLPKAERPVYKVRLKLDLVALGLPETATATDLERAALAKAPQKKKSRGADELAANLEAELDGQDPAGRLTRVAPGIFELSIQKHDFALILVE
jgi:hypothetical protein